jgi:hypothetical protein
VRFFFFCWPLCRFASGDIFASKQNPGLDMAPPKAAGATAKKQRLTLSQLAAYDDILTDALVDHVS